MIAFTTQGRVNLPEPETNNYSGSSLSISREEQLRRLNLLKKASHLRGNALKKFYKEFEESFK